MLVNLSNHPSDKWSERQLNSAIKKYKSVVDLPFPNISPFASSAQVLEKVKAYFSKCLKLLAKSTDRQNAVHIMGESTFTFALVKILKSKKIKCIASTTVRKVIEKQSSRTYYFSFIKFREY